MIPNHRVRCVDFPCTDVRHAGYLVPSVEVDPEKVWILMISECAPADPKDDYYAGGESLFQKTTVQAFNDAGIEVSSIADILDLGVYLTTAVKCGKTGYGISSGTIKTCSFLLEEEIALFPRLKVILLMGDVAIKALAPQLAPALKPESLLWISFPKGSSKIQTDLTRDQGWKPLKGSDLKWINLISVNETWSAFSLRPYKPGEERQLFR